MVAYEDHSKDIPKIKTAIKDYLTSRKSQEVCANDHQISLSAFRYYYHNAKFMEIIKEEMSGGKKKEKPQKNPEDLIREIFSPSVKNNKTDSDKKIRIKKDVSSSKKIKSLSEKTTEDFSPPQRPPSAHRSNSANKYKREDSNIDINQYITKPTLLPL
jgi:hypothetical protein